MDSNIANGIMSAICFLSIIFAIAMYIIYRYVINNKEIDSSTLQYGKSDNPNIGSFNGCGGKFYGHTPTTDGYITTDWLIFFFVPVIPYGSYEIINETGSFGNKTYQFRKLKSLYIPQVLTIGSIGWIICISIILVVILGGISGSFSE
jgi:hypothetical protein